VPFFPSVWQTQGKDLLVALSDSGKLSLLTFCNEMNRFTFFTVFSLSRLIGTGYYLGCIFSLVHQYIIINIIDDKLLSQITNYMFLEIN
jgi:hypothetical protein